jgi:hypothetical protein
MLGLTITECAITESRYRPDARCRRTPKKITESVAWNCQLNRSGICLTSEMGCSVRRADSMAQKVQVLLVDDLDGSEATETVSFGLDGAVYEIDLSSGNAGKLRKELAHYVEHARKASAPARRRRARTGPGRERSAQIRAWAKQRGYKVNERGRIPANIVAEYEAAH